jgi:hypothetical protein
MCARRETDVRKSAEKFHPFYAAAVFPWWLNALYNKYHAIISIVVLHVWKMVP